MIFIHHIGNDVVLDIEHGLHTETPRLRFTWACGSEITAAALAAVLRRALESRVKAAGTEAYERGWKDARSKRRRLREWWRVTL